MADQVSTTTHSEEQHPPQRDLYLPRRADILEIVEETPQERLLRLKMADGVPLGHKPGQFVQVCCFGIGEAPISMASAADESGTFDLCVRRVGNVTGALHRTVVGDTVGIRGPYGNGFPLDTLADRDLLIVGGGIGLVPLRGLIQAVLAQRELYRKVTILYGFKRPEEMLFRDELTAWGAREDVDLRLTIDRAHPDWSGHVGVITTLFPELTLDAAMTKAIVVGPPIMYQFVITECRLKGIADENILLSLERHMKCGVGKCGHCQINGKYCCLDGPVFTFSELKYLWEAI